MYLPLFLLFLVLPLLTISILKQETTKDAHAYSLTNPDLYGFAAGYAPINLSSTELAQQLDDYKALGARWIRFDFPWDVIQPTSATSYNWSKTDAVVSAAIARGIKVLGILDNTPSWAAGNSTAYGNFAAAVVQHYAPLGVHYWEIYNEPNGGEFTPAYYTSLLKAAYPAMKQADPTAFVLAGGSEPAATSGSSYSPIDFLTGMYQNGAKGYFDALTHHPYCYDAINAGYTCPMTTVQNWSAWSQMQDTNPSLRSVMIANGDGNKQIWATEFGAPTGGDSTAITETQQAQMVHDGYALFSSYSWAGPMLWYTYHDPCTTTTDRECYFGIVRYDYSHKPAYATYQSLATAATATATPMVNPTPTQAPQSTWRIEAGGNADYIDSKGNTWQADTGITGGSIVDRGNITIANTTDPRIYQTEHYSMTSASYVVPNGNYTVNLDFAETTGSGVTGAGQRIFDVALNGSTVLSSFDVYAQAGGTNIALMETFTTTVTNGTMSIAFTPHMNAPEINGIEILPQTNPTNTPIPTLTPTFTPIPTNTPIPTSVFDTTPPTVTITNPVNGGTVKRASTVTITATASDNIGVTQVVFTTSNGTTCTDTTSPYTCAWSVPGKPNAKYTITAKAYDAAGNSGINTVTVTAK